MGPGHPHLSDGPERPGDLGAGTVPGQGTWVLASYGQRAGAAIVDFLVKAVFAVLLLLAAGAAFGIGFAATDETGGVVAVIVALILGFAAFAIASLFYEPIYMSLTDGQTLGKQLTGCRVVRTSRARMTFGRATLREVLVKWGLFGVVGNTITAGFPLATLVDVLWPLWDEENRALHDMLASTRVIKSR